MTPDTYQKRLLVLHLFLIEGIGPVTIDYIISNKPPLCAWHDFYSYDISDWVHHGLSLKHAQMVVKGLGNKDLLDQELARLTMHAFQWITVYDDDYPHLLKHSAQPPAILYIKGAALSSLSKQEKNIALVGSRAADEYANRVVSLFVPALVAQGWTTVSGGAIGVDTMVHQATVQAGGRTIVVLGSGLLRPYPRSNNKLFNQVVESGGSIVSPFGLTIDPIAGNFPARNRIIAGLSAGCIVVQAAHKSGASITAHYALDAGRSVFAVPGMIDNPLSVGCHMLLKEGALVAASIQEVLAELGESVTVPNMSLSFSLPQKNTVKNKEDSATNRLVFYCKEMPRSLDELAKLIDCSPYETQQLLFDLQLDGLLSQNFAGQWVVL